MSDKATVLIEFLRVWGHPTRNIIMGEGQRAWVSEWIANNLVGGGYARRVDERRTDTEN